MAGQNEIGVIFDCDGTLVDSMTVWRELEADLANRAHATLTREDKDTIMALTIPETAAYFHTKFGLGQSSQDVVEIIDEFMLDFYTNRALLRPGAAEFLVGLHELGVPMSVASSTPPHLLRACFDSLDISQFMDAILSVDDVGASKREPVLFDHCREVMGTPKAGTWGFEDALYAVRTLRQAGYRTFAIYDCDLSGTYEELSQEADEAALSFTELSAEGFVTLAQAYLQDYEDSAPYPLD